jgi:hypothetical protein
MYYVRCIQVGREPEESDLGGHYCSVSRCGCQA